MVIIICEILLFSSFIILSLLKNDDSLSDENEEKRAKLGWDVVICYSSLMIILILYLIFKIILIIQ